MPERQKQMINGDQNNTNIIYLGTEEQSGFRLVVPALMKEGHSFVSADTDRTAYRRYAPLLKRAGYDVRRLDFGRPEESGSYNPFRYMEDEMDIWPAVLTIIKNTKPGQRGDYFMRSEIGLLSALFMYVCGYGKKEHRSMACIYGMLEEMEKSGLAPAEKIFNEIEKQDPDSPSLRQFKFFVCSSGQTYPNVISSCRNRMKIFSEPEIKRITETDTLDIGSVGNRKTAVFVITPENRKETVMITAMMLAQAVKKTYGKRDRTYSPRADPAGLPRVKIIINGISSSGAVYSLGEDMPVINKKGISVTMRLSSIREIAETYPDDTWPEIPGYCEYSWRSILRNCVIRKTADR